MNILSKIVAITFIASLMSGCGSSSSSSSSGGSVLSAVAITGTVSSPSGVFAFNEPTGFKHYFAQIFGSNAYAAVFGSSPVGSGVIVNLIEIDATGNQVGAIIATGTTISGGTFTIDAPSTFTPAAKYVIRAEGTTDMDAIVTDTAVDIDPSTHATKTLLVDVTTTAGSLANVTIEAVKEIQNLIDGLGNDINTAGLTGSASATALMAEMQNDEEARNMLASTVSNGAIHGKVTNAAGVGLANIKIVARDYNKWLIRAMTRTNVNGDYTLHLPPSLTQGYIVGALNHTNDAAMSASEWYTAEGGAAGPFGADRVTVATNTPTGLDFQLDDGTRISGTVTNSTTSTALRGIIVLVSDVATGFPVTVTRTRADGTYTINVRSANKYVITAKNSTLQPYATGVYNGPAVGGSTTAGGALLFDGGTIITPTAGTAINADMVLIPGSKIDGDVIDGATTTAVAGIIVRFFSANTNSTSGGYVGAMPTNKMGKFRMWVQPGAYTVRSYGQSTDVTLAKNEVATHSFDAAVSSTTIKVTSDGTMPVSQVKVQVFNNTGGAFLGFEPTNGDGSVTVYSLASITTARFTFIVDGGQAEVGSAVYNGSATPTSSTSTSPTALSIGSATVVDMTATPSLGTITLPAGNTLSGTLAAGAGGARVLQINNGVTAPGTRFLNARSQGDGSYTINLPPSGTYYMRVCDPTTGFANTVAGYCTATHAVSPFALYTMSGANTVKDW